MQESDVALERLYWIYFKMSMKIIVQDREYFNIDLLNSQLWLEVGVIPVKTLSPDLISLLFSTSVLTSASGIGIFPCSLFFWGSSKGKSIIFVVQNIDFDTQNALFKKKYNLITY